MKNVLTGLHKTKGDSIKDKFSNQALRDADYKQFIWCVFKKLGKGKGGLILRLPYGK